MRDEVILLHGLWMRSATLLLLKRRLNAAGFHAHCLDYASLFQDPEIAMMRLVRRMLASSASRVHLVGHSLGGLIALQATRGRRDLPQGNIVCLGSPLNGSATARRIAESRAATLVLGRSLRLLVAGIEGWDGSRPVGVIAGTSAMGIGRMLGAVKGRSDGTVSQEETRLVGINAYLECASSHTGLPFSAIAAKETIAFLQNSSFR